MSISINVVLYFMNIYLLTLSRQLKWQKKYNIRQSVLFALRQILSGINEIQFCVAYDGKKAKYDFFFCEWENMHGLAVLCFMKEFVNVTRNR